jgi:serine/threonine protein kinase
VQALQKLHHPNIIRLLGSVYHPQPLTFCLVLEYCNAGDLDTALGKHTSPNFFFHVAGSISKGMTYLHHRGIIHRDVKPGNVLLDGCLTSGIFSVKMTDFGVATDSNAPEMTAETGTYRYMAPEVIRHESYTQTADVYSFGIVLWQLITREVPFADRNQISAASLVATDDLRPPFPEGISSSVKELIERCWSSAPEERPSFDEITEILIDIDCKLTNEEKEWMEAPLGHSAYKKREPKAVRISNTELKALELQLVANQKKPPKADKRTSLKKILFSRKSSYF